MDAEFETGRKAHESVIWRFSEDLAHAKVIFGVRSGPKPGDVGKGGESLANKVLGLAKPFVFDGG